MLQLSYCIVFFPEDFNKLCSVPMVIPERPGYPPPPLGPVPPVQPVPPGFPPGPQIMIPRPPVEYPYPSREPPSKNSKSHPVTFLALIRLILLSLFMLLKSLNLEFLNISFTQSHV